MTTPLWLDNIFSLFRRSPLAAPTAVQTATQRAGDLAARYAAYEGIYPAQLKATDSDPYAQDNVAEPIARELVDIQTAFLIGKGATFTCENDRHQSYLGEAFEAMDFDRALHEMALSGHIGGDVFVKVIPAASPSDHPRFVTLDPRSIEVETAADDICQVTEWRILGQRRDEKGKSVFTRQRITKEGDADAEFWVIRDEESHDNRHWHLVAEEPFPLPTSPVLHAQHLPRDRSFFGTSELEPAILKSISEINFLSSSIKRISRLYAHPLVYVTGVNSGQKIDWSPGKMPLLPPSAKVESVDTKADITALQAERENRRNALFEVCQIPSVVLGRVDAGVGALPGVAIRLMYGPMVSKNQAKQQSYGALLERLASLLLWLGGWGEGIAVTVAWPDPLPANEIENLDVLAREMELGLRSKESAARDRGIDWDVEKGRIEAEKPEEPEPLPDASHNAAPPPL